MINKKKIILIVSIILSCGYINAEIGIGENKELIVTEHISVPIPDSSWNWYVGNVIVEENIKISTFWCNSADGNSKLVFIYFAQKLKENKKKFAEDFIKSSVSKAAKIGFELLDFKVEEKNIPWGGSLHYSGELRKGKKIIYFSGAIAFGKAIYVIQYQGDKKNPVFLKKVLKGIKNLDKSKQSKGNLQ